MTVKIPVSVMEIDHGGKAIWVHAPDGTTPLRIQCTGKVVVDKCEGDFTHGDINVKGDIHICVPKRKAKT